ncbi:MAG: DUF3500 domain-containing protein [Limisphaerales bacterium]
MNSPCSDCHDVSRRGFLKTTAFASAALAAGNVTAAPTMKSKAEKLSAELFYSLNDQQRKIMALPFNHKLRQKTENNWSITETFEKVLTADQTDLAKQAFLAMHSEEYRDAVLKQFVHDNNKFSRGSIAFFGDPKTDKFQMVFTGRHTTRRVDGNSVGGATFGGPIFYGHAVRGTEKKDHQGNVYWYQAKQANKLFSMLNGKQREQALEAKGRREQSAKTVKLKGKGADLEGIAFGDLAKDQKGQVNKVIADLLALFRKEDRDEALKQINANGFDNHHIAFYKHGDIGDDRVWDVWQIEGPAMVWYFRGEPHVHTWAHIRAKA